MEKVGIVISDNFYEFFTNDIKEKLPIRNDDYYYKNRHDIFFVNLIKKYKYKYFYVIYIDKELLKFYEILTEIDYNEEYVILNRDKMNKEILKLDNINDIKRIIKKSIDFNYFDSYYNYELITSYNRINIKLARNYINKRN